MRAPIPKTFDTLIKDLNAAANWLDNQPKGRLWTDRELRDMEDLRCLSLKMAKAVTWYLEGK